MTKTRIDADVLFVRAISHKLWFPTLHASRTTSDANGRSGVSTVAVAAVMNDVGWLDIPLGLAVGVVDKRRGFEYTSLHVESWAGGCERTVKFTTYFGFIRRRPDRAIIQEEWIKRVISSPVREVVQKDGRIRRWAPIKEMDNRHLRVVLLSDRETVHNAFFDRRFKS